MKYDSQLYDLPVVDRLSGEVVGYLRSVVCKPGKKRADGVIYEEKGWLRRCRFIPWQAVSVMGEKSVVIDCSKKTRASKPAACLSHEHKVYNSEGAFLGRVSNYLIDEKSGSVLGMEISASIVDDLKFGRKIIENTGNIMKGENFLMLADGAETDGKEANERRSEDERLH